MMAANRHIGVRAPLAGVVYPARDTLARYIAQGTLGTQSLTEALAQSFAAHADRIALAGPEGDITYRALDEITDRLGAALLTLGLVPLDRVVFQLGNCNELIYGFIACLKAGLIPLCTLAAHREQEIGYLGAHAQARMHFVQGDDAKFDDVAFAEKMRASIPSMRWIVQARGARRGTAHALTELIESVSAQAARDRIAAMEHDPYQVAVFQLSGGTTGVPKIIPRFHNEYATMMRAIAAWNGYRSDDTLFMPLPMMHNLNMGTCFGPFLLMGGTITVAPNLTPDVLVGLFDKYDPTIAVVGGPIVARLEPAIRAGKLPLRRLRAVFAANGAPKLPELLGVPAYHLFGMTEGVIMYTRERDPDIVRDRMVGRPVSASDSVKLFEIGTEREVTADEIEGECAFAGPYTIHGYYDAPERDRETFTSEGYYRSGDLMLKRTIDGITYYEFRGRTKDVIDRGGEKINCEEVEHAILRHESVAAAAVVPMPDPIFGERACAYLVMRRAMPSIDVAALGAHLAQVGIAKFKWPERVEIVDEFPMTKSGKLSKPRLREMISERLAAEHTKPSP